MEEMKERIRIAVLEAEQQSEIDKQLIADAKHIIDSILVSLLLLLFFRDLRLMRLCYAALGDKMSEMRRCARSPRHRRVFCYGVPEVLRWRKKAVRILLERPGNVDITIPSFNIMIMTIIIFLI
jgi:hypothetical protein